MADKTKETSQEESQEQIENQTKAKSGFSFIKFGIPLLVAQAVIAFLLANYVIVPRIYGDPTATAQSDSTTNKNGSESEEEAGKKFGKIYNIEDVIANPADSKGLQFVLVNFGFEVEKESDLEIMNEREVQIRDILINILSSKMIGDLDGAEDKENLRIEIKNAVEKVLPKGRLLNVYFSNYIIQ
jgi:flagellar FliL protein